MRLIWMREKGIMTLKDERREEKSREEEGKKLRWKGKITRDYKKKKKVILCQTKYILTYHIDWPETQDTGHHRVTTQVLNSLQLHLSIHRWPYAKWQRNKREMPVVKIKSTVELSYKNICNELINNQASKQKKKQKTRKPNNEPSNSKDKHGKRYTSNITNFVVVLHHLLSYMQFQFV